MAIKIVCPRCSTRHQLRNPYPVPGSEFHCPCGQLLAISYPPGLVETIRASSGRFEDDPATSAAPPARETARRATPVSLFDATPRAAAEVPKAPPSRAPESPEAGGIASEQNLFHDLAYRRGLHERALLSRPAAEVEGTSTEADPDPLAVECIPYEDSDPGTADEKRPWWKALIS